MAAPLPLVVVTESLDPSCADWLERSAEVVRCAHDDAGNFSKLLARARGLVVRTYTRVDAALLDRAPQMKVVGRAGVGLDNIDVEACRQRGVAVVYTPDANTQAVVEYTLALMLDALRPRCTIDTHTSAQGFHELRRTHVGVQLADLTLGILGFGRIGKRLGAVAGALGMRLLVNDLLPDAQLRAEVRYAYEYVGQPTLLAQSDVLSIHVDGRTGNRHLIDSEALARLKPSCLLINTSRGMVVDAEALATWARTVADRGGQAVLDVHEPEPPDEGHPLYGLPNVRLLPHLASRTDRALESMSWVVRDVAAVLAGQPPRYPAS